MNAHDLHRIRNRTGSRRACSALLLLSALCVLPGLLTARCGGASSPDVVVVRVGDASVTREELDLYLALNSVPDQDGESAGDEADRVKSRLLDALVDEKRMAVEAARRGVEVSDQEIDAHVEMAIRGDGSGKELPRGQRRRLVRQRLMVLELEEMEAGRQPPPTEEEVRAYVERSRGRLAPRKRLRMRSLRFESPDEAIQAASRIRSGRMSFIEAVVTYETDPGQGVLLEFTWESLSDDVRDALADLKPGEVSRPVAFHGDTFLFQLESWLSESSGVDGDLLHRARGELERQRRRQACDRLRQRLRTATPVRILENRLPFRYVPDQGNDDARSGLASPEAPV